ncbi:Trafficking protein particle complex subunit 10 [Chamberlinius hualienensis]
MESKPIISYAGDEVLFSSLQQGITQQLPVDHVEWRRSFGRAAKTVYIEAAFVKFTEGCIHKENDWRLIGETFFHAYWTDCVDVDQYKSTVRDDITNWLTILKNHGVTDWLIVVVETMDGKKGNKAKLLPRASVIDKIKHDFCNKQQDRCLSLLDPLKSDSRGAESWQSLLISIRQLLLQAYNRHLGKFEEHMRSQRERRNEPGWSFCEYFILQEELAFVFEMLGVYDEALVQYDELDALFTQFVLNSKVGDTPEWLHNFYRTCDSWLGLTLSKPQNSKKQWLIRDGKASLLDIRNYLFSRQCSLLLLLFRPWEVAQRTLPFLHNCINELQILEVCLPPGAVSCWVFLSCLEILQTCEKFHDSTQVEAYSLYTAGLWAYARDKLRELGELCGLMPGMKETSEQLQLVVGLLSGLVEVDLLEEKDSANPITKLKQALSSHDAFQHRYLELSELAMGTFKHIGRIRSARLIGKDLSQFYMKLGEPQKAAVFLTDILKTCLLENWAILAANTRLDLAKCYHETKDHDKYP